jgi:hypothetical protein
MQTLAYLMNRFPFSSLTKHILVLLLVGFSCTGCKFVNYSFTGTTISPDIKTISVANFVNNSGGGPANITQNFTERVKEYYQQNSTLKIYPPDGTADLQVEGDLTPIAPTQGQFASLNRLTVRVQVRFTNTKNETENFDAPFSFYADFPQERTLTAVENELLTVIFDQIVLDIFNKSVANW